MVFAFSARMHRYIFGEPNFRMFGDEYKCVHHAMYLNVTTKVVRGYFTLTSCESLLNNISLLPGVKNYVF